MTEAAIGAGDCGDSPVVQVRRHGELLIRAGSTPADVLAMLLAAVRTHGEDAGLLSDVAVVLHSCGLVDDAREMLDRAAAIDPDHPDVAVNSFLLNGAPDSDLDQGAVEDGRVRLNVGAGDDRRPGFLSIDLRADVSDVVASVDALPVEDGSVSEVLALDILEHVPSFRTHDLLKEWRRVLEPGGMLVCRVPNLEALASLLVAGQATTQVIENIYGGHRWGPDGAFDAHHHGFTPQTFEDSLGAAGFVVLELDDQPNMTAVAVRP